MSNMLHAFQQRFTVVLPDVDTCHVRVSVSWDMIVNRCSYKKTAGPSGLATLKMKTNYHETNGSEAITVL